MDLIEQLLIKKWKGDISRDEQQKLNKLTSILTKEEKQAYHELEIYWKSEGLEKPEVNQTHLWNRLEQFINEEDSLFEPASSKGKWIQLLNRKVLTVAASVALLFVFTFLFLDEFQPQEKAKLVQSDIPLLEKVNEAGKKSTLKLPDGSTVILNSKSKLIIPEKFIGNTREVTLEGEAYFEIVPNAEMPFIVNTSGAKVRVLGTAFNLRNFTSQENAVLNVVEGKVKFTGDKDQSNLLVTAEKAAILNTTTGKITSIDFNEDAVAWSRGELVFKSASFNEIINTLENWYGVKIEVNKKVILQNGFTGRYRNASLKEVLNGISFSVNFDYEIKGKKVLIK